MVEQTKKRVMESILKGTASHNELRQVSKTGARGGTSKLETIKRQMEELEVMDDQRLLEMATVVDYERLSRQHVKTRTPVECRIYW